jgi:hypothetical protein
MYDKRRSSYPRRRVCRRPRKGNQPLMVGRRWGTVLVGIALLLAAPGCGGSGEKAEPSASKLMKAAGEKTRAAGNARFELTLRTEPASELDIKMKGKASTLTPAMSGTMDLGPMWGDDPPPGGVARFVTDGVRWWFKFGGLDKWVLEKDTEAEPADSTDISTSMRTLGATTDDARLEGEEALRGQHTRRFSATMNLKKFRDSLPPDERKVYERGLRRLKTDKLPVKIWVGADGLIYRFHYELDLSQIAGGPQGKVVAVFDLYDHGKAEPEEGPAAEKTIVP